MSEFKGTDLNDQIDGTSEADIIVGAGGDDQITGGAQGDTIVGDYENNLLPDDTGEISFAEYAQSANWTVTQYADGHNQMSQTIDTVAGGTYELSFDLANNFSAGNAVGAVEVVWNGEVIGTHQTESGVFQQVTVSLTGIGGPGELIFRSTEPDGSTQIDTSGPIYTYDRVVDIGGQDVTVAAIAEGQPNLYQVLNGTLMVFDPETQQYTQAGADATVVVNAIGFNIEDDLIYGIAVRDGFDSLGNPVSQRDLVMLDGDGNSYGMGATPYRSWTGDFDSNGNLWAFEADMDYFMMVDVSERDADGNPLVTRFNLPDELVSVRVWDVAYDAATQTFRGVVRPSAEGADATLIIIDVSGDEPQFELLPVTSTLIDGVAHEGAPAVTFGAAIQDANGTLYVGGNSGDHDMDNSTPSSGGFYRVDIDEQTGEATLVLVADAPRAGSNDGASDPRSIDPFSPIDVSSSVLITDIRLVNDPNGAASFDDTIDGNAGADTIFGNLGDDQLVGSSAGDEISGGTGNDFIYGGNGPDAVSTIVSFYDENGQRFDQFGNLLQEDDDVLNGGEGDDLLQGSAGHDILDGGSGQDELFGGSGDDRLYGGGGDDSLSGGGQSDQMAGGDGSDTLNGGSGEDILSGGAGDDSLKGSSGNDVLYGDEGDDAIRGDVGTDHLEGGEGNDKLNGGSDDDVLLGQAGNDHLNGGSGDDILKGGDGKDKIYLGAGDDIATGGAGSDRFVFRSEDLDGGTDRITDFSRDSAQSDRLDLRQLDLLEAGMTAEDWIAQNVSQGSGGGVIIDLDGTLLMFDARLDGDNQDLFNDVIDGLVF